MPSIKTMVYKFHAQVKQLCRKSNPESKNWQYDVSKAKRIVLLWDARGDFPCLVVKTKLPEELQTKFRLSRAAPIHNLAFLAHHYHSRHSESSGDTALCSAYLAETKTTSKTPKEYKYFMTKPASSFAAPYPSSSVPVSGNWETGCYCYSLCITKATSPQQWGKEGLIAFSVLVTAVTLSFRYALNKAFSKGRMSHYSFLLKLWMSKIIARWAAECEHPWGLTARCWTEAHTIYLGCPYLLKVTPSSF